MEYRKDIYPDGNIEEQYEGTAEEIIKLMNSQVDEKGLIFDIVDATTFIVNRLYEVDRLLTREQVMEVLEIEEDYMRSVGIIKD